MEQTAREEEEHMEAETRPQRRVVRPETVEELHALMLSQPLTFHVPIPDGYTVDEASTFKRLIREALEPVVADAMLDIDSRRVQA